MMSAESDGIYRGSSSHESLEGDVPHQITLVRIFILKNNYQTKSLFCI